MADRKTAGHLAALFTILVWGTTFVCTKVLLRSFTAVEILIYRFVLGFLALCLMHPHRMRGVTRRQELFFLGAGLCGVCLYYFLENTALSFTMASNVGVITTTAALFSAVFAYFFTDEKSLGRNFIIGFLLALSGIALISFNGAELHINPKGDLLALCSAMTWGIYSVLFKEISSFGYGTICSTRRIFAWGLLFLLLTIPGSRSAWDFSLVLERQNLLSLLFLGIVASALCFVTWNYAVEAIGTVTTSIYLYLNTVVTVIASFIVLSEPITAKSLLGTALILLGLMISERKGKKATGLSQ